MKPILKIVLLFICQTNLLAQELIIQNQENGRFEFDYKEKKAIFIEIENIRLPYDNVSLEINLSDDFRLLTEPTISPLIIGKKTTVFFAMQTLATAKSGDYSFKIKLLTDDEIIDEVSLDLTVKKYSSIAINPINKPSYYQASDNNIISYLVRNNGNIPEILTLKSTSGEVLGEEVITLEVGESKTVQTKNDFPKDNPGMTMISFNLEAYLEGNPVPFSIAFTSSYLSNSTAKIDNFQRFPVNASLSYNVFNTNFGNYKSVQFDINGRGFIDRKSKRELSFIARGPNRFNTPGFGMTDQYYAGYKDKKVSLEVGDIPYRISELIEGSRYARGFNFSFNPIINGFNVFYLKPRYFNDIKTEYGLSYERKLNSQFSWKVILMHKDHVIKYQKKATDFMSLTGAIQKENLTLDFELGLSRTDNNVSAAFSNTGFWKFSKFLLTSNTIITSKDYYGYYSNSMFYSNALNYYINKKLRITFNSNISQLNPSLDQFYFTTSPFYTIQSVNLSYTLNKNNNLNLFAINGKREDRQEIKNYDFKEQIVRLSYKLNLGSWSVINDTDFGTTENLLLEDSYSKENEIFRNRFSLQFDNRKSISLGGFAEYLNTSKYITSLEKTEFLFYGMNAGLRINNLLNLSLNYRNNFTPEELYRQQNYIDAVATFNFKNHHISLTGTLGKNPIIESDKIFLGSIKYTANLNVPLFKKQNLGNLIGTLEGEKTAGVIFNFKNQKIITDENGQFKLKDIEAGPYNLGIEKSSLGYGNIIDADGPLVFEIKENSTNYISLNVVKTGKIKGTIDILGEGVYKGTLENILIEISRNNFSQLTTTDSYGIFTFSELKPGDYSIKIVSKNVLNKYNILSSNNNISVEKGVNTAFHIQMEKKKKEIRFQGETIILSAS